MKLQKIRSKEYFEGFAILEVTVLWDTFKEIYSMTNLF